MAELATKIQKDAARSGSIPGATNIPSSSAVALDTVSTHASRTGVNKKY
jgi:3-mercaptopyruvate sulfurtransferase SseA